MAVSCHGPRFASVAALLIDPVWLVAAILHVSRRRRNDRQARLRLGLPQIASDLETNTSGPIPREGPDRNEPMTSLPLARAAGSAQEALPGFSSSMVLPGPARAVKALSRTSRSALLTRNRVALLLPALTALVISGRHRVGLARLATCVPLHCDHHHQEKESVRRADADLTSGAPSGMTTIGASQRVARNGICSIPYLEHARIRAFEAHGTRGANLAQRPPGHFVAA